MSFFSEGIRDFRRTEAKQVNKKWTGVSDTITEYERIEKDVMEVVKKFNGQKIPGELLGVSHEIVLPQFSQIVKDYRPTGEHIQVDILARKENESWIIEVRNNIRRLEGTIEQIKRYLSHIEAKAWLVVFSEVSPILKNKIAQEGIWISSLSEWNKLKTIVGETQ